MHQECVRMSQREVVILENFFLILGFGFLLLCFAVVLCVCGMFGYFIYIKVEKNKKLEVASAKKTSSHTTIE